MGTKVDGSSPTGPCVQQDVSLIPIILLETQTGSLESTKVTRILNSLSTRASLVEKHLEWT